jgi:hypothetical protein
LARIAAAAGDEQEFERLASEEDVVGEAAQAVVVDRPVELDRDLRNHDD